MRQQDARHAYRCSICMEIANSSMDGKILIYVQFSKNKVFLSSDWHNKLPFYNDARYNMWDGVNGKHEFKPVFFRYVAHEEQVSDDIWWLYNG